MLYEYKNHKPQIAEDSFIAPTAEIIGKVTIEEGCSIWFNTVLRADIEAITIKKNTSIQDGSVLHVDDNIPLVVGENVTVGHAVVLHACTIGDNTMVGMGATVLTGAKIGKNCIVAAGAVVLENQEFEDNTLIAGIPAKAKRVISDEAAKGLYEHAQGYVELGKNFTKECKILSKK